MFCPYIGIAVPKGFGLTECITLANLLNKRSIAEEDVVFGGVSLRPPTSFVGPAVKGIVPWSRSFSSLPCEPGDTIVLIHGVCNKHFAKHARVLRTRVFQYHGRA